MESHETITKTATTYTQDPFLPPGPYPHQRGRGTASWGPPPHQMEGSALFIDHTRSLTHSFTFLFGAPIMTKSPPNARDTLRKGQTQTCYRREGC